MKTLDLHNLLQQKLNAFTKFLTATIALQELSGSESDLKRIKSLINNRQDCINIIDRIDDEINSLRKENPAFILTLPREERKRIKVIAEELDDTTSKAAHVNRKLKKMIRFKHDDIKNQLLKMRHIWRGIQGYAGKGHKTHEPRFLDVRL